MGEERPTRVPSAGSAARRGPRRRRALKIALAAVALLGIAVAALIGYGLSERGLPFIVARIVAQTGGRITVDEPSGSVAGTMRFRRITWHGADATVTADDIVVDWNPGALWSKRLSLRGLGARHVDIALKPSPGPTGPPTDLRLPLAVDIERLAVAELVWRAGPRGGHVSGLEFGYAGDAQSHRISGLRLVSDFGSLDGNLTVDAREPLAIAGNASIVGDEALAGARGSAQLSGTVARIAIVARGTLREAALSLQAIATPFAEAPFASAIAELTGVDAASFDAALPHTRARVRLDAKPRGAGIAGTVDVVNEDAGPIDAERLPVAQVTARFVLDDDMLALDALDATLPGGGGARGDGRIALGAPRAARFTLDVRDLDLARVHTKLVTTRLGGRLAADAGAERQTFEGDVHDRDLGLAFTAVVAGERVDVTRFRASTPGGSVSGSARLALNAANDFSLRASMRRLDPSRFAAVPAASLDGTVEASGILRPRWRADAAVVVAPGSRLEGVPAAGTFRGAIAAGRVRDAALDVALASATLRVTGGVGSADDRLAFTIDAPRIAEIAPLLPTAVPRPLAGGLQASGVLAVTGNAIGGNAQLRAHALRAGPYAVATLQARGSIAPPAAASRDALGERALSIDIAATQVTVRQRAFDAIHAAASGTLASHRATFAVRARDFDTTLALAGTLANADAPARAAWTGTVTAFENRGSVPVRLRAPASLALRDGFVRLADARIDAAGGAAEIVEFVWNAGRITTRGSFSGVAVADAAALAGQALPFESTLVAAGEWSIAATPRLNGRFAIRRERGDVFADVGADGSADRRALGVTTLAVSGTFDDDALEATASFASERGGTANGSLAIGAASGASTGKIDPAAPLRLALRADLESLALLQPWLGTTAAVNGRAHLDASATGTVGDPRWAGELAGEALRVDAPRYGVHVTNGRLRARLAPTGIALDEAYFAGGDGSFTATGLIALPGERGTAPTRVTWKAERFRAANRPDLRLVVNGDGAIAIENKRLALTGNVAIVEGRLEYESSPTGTLAPDIVVKGRTPPSRRDARDLPLALDVDVDLGRALTFSGEGIDTGLAGRIRITTSATGALLGRGTIRAVNGTYFAFGQKLTIDRGRLIFDGALDNPALDVVALRKNLAVEAGVELSGTVKVPQVRVTSNPPVPENEALAWLVTGQGLNNTSRVDYAALSAASAALLGKGGKPFTAQLAQRIGLDDISVKTGPSGAEGAASQVVVFGKRLSDRLSLGYEQGLSLATSAVRLEYALSRQVTLRAEAGAVSGVGIVYRRVFR
jgi:translocation and assembly module TamB